MDKPLILSNDDDWEALYIKGRSVEQDHSLECYILELAEKHGFTYSTLNRKTANGEDIERAYQEGTFPLLESDLTKDYTKD